MSGVRPILVLAFAVLGCKHDDPPPAARTDPPPVPALRDAAPAAPPAPTWYRATVHGKLGDVHAYLGVPPAGAKADVVLRVGRNEMTFPATFDGKQLAVTMPPQLFKIEATLGADGTLSGAITGSWKIVGDVEVPLAATPVAAPDPAQLGTVPGTGAAVDLGEPRTVWKVALAQWGDAKLVIDQLAPGVFEGVLYLDTGNTVTLAGNGRGDRIVLDRFDGSGSNRLDLTLAADRKHLTGAFDLGFELEAHDKLTAARTADYVYTAKPRPVKPATKVTLPDLPELAKLARGPLVVELAGSWCPTCRIAAPVLHDLYRDYRAKGVQVVTLLYELDGDAALDAKQAAAFKQTFDIDWPVVPVVGDLDKFTELVPSGLSDVDPSGFPIFLFLDADRRVVALRAGFPTRETDAFAAATAEMRANFEKLLAAPR